MTKIEKGAWTVYFFQGGFKFGLVELKAFRVSSTMAHKKFKIDCLMGGTNRGKMLKFFEINMKINFLPYHVIQGYYHKHPSLIH